MEERKLKCAELERDYPSPNYSFIKWTGSKKYILKDIMNMAPENIDTYYEPFLGGGVCISEFYKRSNKVVGYDIIKELIDLFNIVKDDYIVLYNHYINLKMESDKYDSPAEFYYNIRNRFNKYKECKDFYFLMRTCVNGLVRFNRKGEFNSSFHHNRVGMKIENLKILLKQWNVLLNTKPMCFYNESYINTLNTVKKGDFVFIDPPYLNTASMYKEAVSIENIMAFLEELNKKDVKWLFTFNGFKDGIDCSYSVLKELYKETGLFKSAKNMFKPDVDVSERFYKNY